MSSDNDESFFLKRYPLLRKLSRTIISRAVNSVDHQSSYQEDICLDYLVVRQVVEQILECRPDHDTDCEVFLSSGLEGLDVFYQGSRREEPILFVHVMQYLVELEIGRYLASDVEGRRLEERRTLENLWAQE